MQTRNKSIWLLASFLVALGWTPARGSLVALWDFRYTGADDRCNNHPGAIVGEPWCVAGPRPGTKALEFDGASYISVEGGPDLDITEQITVAAWIQVNAFDKEWQSVVTKGDSSWRLARTAVENNMSFHVTGITSDNNGRHNNLGVEGNISVADGRWHHVVAVYDGSSVSLYIDGALDKSLAAKGKIATNTYKVMIGENAERTGRGWKGMIGEVAIFNHAMKPAEIEDLCKNGAKDSPREGHADEVARQAEAEIKDMTPPQAIPYLRNTIADYRKWLATQGENAARRDRTPPPDVYVLLGRQMEAAGMPNEQVAAAYEKAFRNVYTNARHLPAAFSWLVAHMPGDYAEGIIRDLARTDTVPYSLVYGITAQLAQEKNWPAIETFLNAMFAEIDDPLTRAAAVDWALRDTGGSSDEFTRYCRGRPGLTRYIFRNEEKTAINHVARGDFQSAAEVYSDILKRCEPNDNRAYYAVKICETLFSGGLYEQAVPALDGFIREYKPRNRSLLVPLTMLKGRSHVNLGDVEQAIDAFLTVLLEYPESAQAPEAGYFVGYCQMLLGNFEDAAASFRLLMRDYPQSGFVAKAQSYLDRIHAMTQQE